ncbi:hypothetical protein M758_4G007200 [Ceratodon purpureus]|uniref:Uncharacterized protein n=1 Tax=Ceratodon purpureus TaxID=3225 RepID=A0A8T0I406_CERPU|nr:hypothetical protein KC19_4G007500 [Ceratodon purpureus]KAG0617676.1 hypothetical protein M758_4G007200 [Ceratodon purpureus]
MGRKMKISSPVETSGRRGDHVIGTSMSSNHRPQGEPRPVRPSQEDYSIVNPVLCPAVVSWLKDPDSVEQGVEDAITKAISHRSANGETTFHDAEMDFSPAQWKEIMEIHTDIPTHTPQFEQMHPPACGDSHMLLTPDRSPNRSGPLMMNQKRMPDVHSNRSTSNVLQSKTGSYNNRPSSSPDNARTPSVSGANSPQHPGMWNSPHHRRNRPPVDMPSPSPPKRFGWMTPTRGRRQAPEPASPDFAKVSGHLRDPPDGNVHASSMKSLRQAKGQAQTPVEGTAGRSKQEKFDKEGKSPGKAWKNLSRSISPLFGGRKTDHSVGNTLKAISRDLGASFQGSRRHGPASVARTPAAVNGNVPNWSGDSSMVAPDLEKDTMASEIGYSSELTRNGSMRSTKSGVGGSHSMFNILGWGKKKSSNGAKINELFQVVDQGSVKLDSNSFKVMEYTIKTLHFKLEQAKKNELTTAEEFKSLQSSIDAAEGKCQQWQQRCQELEAQLGVRQTESKDIELDYEIAKHRRENVNATTPTTPSKAHRFTTLDVTPPMFQKAFEDSKLCTKRLASALCLHIRGSGESATQVITSLLAQQKDASPKMLEKMPRNVIVLYFESFLNTVLYESFENVTFEPNGATTIYDPDLLRQACCRDYHELKKLDWASIERSLDINKPQGAMTIVNPVFHRFFVIRMELILSQLTKVADHETSISLLAAFFNAFKSVWLLHHLAFATELPVTIFRVPARADFDPRFMEQVTTYEEEAVRSRVSVMVSPGFIVNRQTIKCQVFCSSKYQ